MFRHLILPTLVAILLIPDWASAFFRRRSSVPSTPAPTQKVQYYTPVYVSPPCPPMFLAPPTACCPPVAVAPATSSPSPQVVPERMATPKAVSPEKPMTTVVTPKPEKLVEPAPPSLIPNPESKLPEAPVKPVVPVVNVVPEPVTLPPTPVPAMPKLSFDQAPAKDSSPEEKKATPVVPDPAPSLPKLNFDPAPVKEAAPVEPKPAAPALPKMELPSLDLPAAPQLAIPKEVEVKSSPIASEKAAALFETFPIDGAAPATPDEKRIITFYNFTGRDVMLTIDGKSYTLPAKHTVEGKLGSQFTMQIGLGEVHELKVPNASAGMDVVLKK